MKARALFIPAVAALFLVGCGDDKKESDSTTADTTAATTADTTAATTAETAAPETTAVDPLAARIALAEEIAGVYSGEWHNTTFNSTGTIDAVFSVDAATAVATIRLDVGGNVFGAPDPDGLIAEIDLNSAGAFASTSTLFGDFTIEYADGHLVFTAPAVPGLGGRTMTVIGDFSNGTFSGTYNIVDLADGTFETTRA